MEMKITKKVIKAVLEHCGYTVPQLKNIEIHESRKLSNMLYCRFAYYPKKFKSWDTDVDFGKIQDFRLTYSFYSNRWNLTAVDYDEDGTLYSDILASRTFVSQNKEG